MLACSISVLPVPTIPIEPDPANEAFSVKSDVLLNQKS